MKRTLTPLALTALALTAACSDGSQAPTAAPNGRTAPLLSAADGRGVDGHYIVVLNDGANPHSAAAVAGVTPRFVYTAALNGFAAELNQGQLNALQHNPNVSYIQQDGRVSASATQTGATWGLDRVDQRDLPLNSTYNYTPTGAGVHAYIIDTGIKSGHTEFTGRMGNGYDAVTSGGAANDCNGHGSHVAGTVGGTTYGVAKQVTLHPVRVLDCAGSGTNAGVIAGMDWVANNHVKPAVANMSLGGGASTATDDAVNRMHNAGVTVVVAAGNENQNACNVSPARAANAITVGSTTNTDARSSFSNYGTCVDVFAPGSNITSAWYTSTSATNTISGTSMASPHVAGIAALYLQGNTDGDGGDGGQRHHHHLHRQQGDQRRHGLAQPPGVLAAHRRHHAAAAPSGQHVHVHGLAERHRRRGHPARRHILPEHGQRQPHGRPHRPVGRRLRPVSVPLERLVLGDRGPFRGRHLHREHQLPRHGGVLLLAHPVVQRQRLVHAGHHAPVSAS